MSFNVLNVHSLYSQQQQCNKLRLMTRLQKNVSVFQGGQMTPLPLPVGAHGSRLDRLLDERSVVPASRGYRQGRILRAATPTVADEAPGRLGLGGPWPPLQEILRRTNLYLQIPVEWATYFEKRTSKFRFSKFYYPEPSDNTIPRKNIRTILTWFSYFQKHTFRNSSSFISKSKQSLCVTLNLNLSSVGGRSLKLTDTTEPRQGATFQTEPRPRQDRVRPRRGRAI